MSSIAIIGDVHGHVKTLEFLLERLAKEKEIYQVYSVGDLVDRGPSSKEVVQLCIDRGVKPVMGNHSHMFCDYLNGCPVYGASDMFLNNGGDKTMKSYGWDKNIPPEHYGFLSDLPPFIETDDLVISHAGVPAVITRYDWRYESIDTYMWHRNNIGTIKDKIQVYGHTPCTNVHRINREGRLVGINIDTGCNWDGGFLTAFIYPECEVMQVKQEVK